MSEKNTSLAAMWRSQMANGLILQETQRPGERLATATALVAEYYAKARAGELVSGGEDDDAASLAVYLMFRYADEVHQAIRDASPYKGGAGGRWPVALRDARDALLARLPAAKQGNPEGWGAKGAWQLKRAERRALHEAWLAIYDDRSPSGEDIAAIAQYIASLPVEQNGEVFGTQAFGTQARFIEAKIKELLAERNATSYREETPE